MTAQNPAVGIAPTLAKLFIGSLVFGTVNEAKAVLRFVDDDDLDGPAAIVLAAVRALALRGTPPSPQIVADELKRSGQWTDTVGLWLSAAVTSGACTAAAQNYAAALVAESFRAKVESFGNALVSTKDTMSEGEINALVERTVTGIRGVGARLAELRGDA